MTDATNATALEVESQSFQTTEFDFPESTCIVEE